MAVLRDHLEATLRSKIKDSDGAISNYLPIYNDWTKRTAAEISAGITPVNYAYPPLHVHRYGAAGDGSTDDYLAWQTAIDVAEQAGGGVVTCNPGATYAMTQAPVLAEGVSIDGQWARLNFTLGAGNVYGLRVVTNSGVRRLRVYTVSSTSPSSQLIFHAPITIGNANNAGDTPAAVNEYQTAYNWFIEDVELGNAREFGPCIQGMGDIYNGVIRRVTIPDSATCSGIHFDWGNVGTVSSTPNISTTRTDFDNGDCYTTHPHNITIEDITIGSLSVAQSGGLGSHGVRLSACYGITVGNLSIENYTMAAYTHTGGDLGFEFALAIEKPQACKNNVCRNVTITELASSGSPRIGANIDTLADNIYRDKFLASYSPLIEPLMHGSVIVEDCNFLGPSADSHYGVRIIQARGVTIRRNACQKWTNGIWVDEFCQDILVEENDVFSNRQAGILVGFSQVREGTERVKIRKNSVYGNGTDATNAGIRVTRGKSVWIEANIVGQPGESTQNFGIRIDDVAGACADIRVDGNHCLGATSHAYALQGSSPADALQHRVITSFSNNTIAYGVTGLTTGQTYLPLGTRLIGQSRQMEWLNPNSSAPTEGTWYKGDKVWQTGEAAAGVLGHSVTAAGTFGTLTSITNGSTTNGSPTFTCSLSGITVNTTQASYSCTVSSATGIRAGMKCSIASAGITDAYILAVSGTTLQLDTQANATQTGGAFTTTGLIEGEVISIDTTTPIAGAVILKITGTNVTIDINASDTQSGRTITYTAPVFKAWAAIAA